MRETVCLLDAHPAHVHSQINYSEVTPLKKTTTKKPQFGQTVHLFLGTGLIWTCIFFLWSWFNFDVLRVQWDMHFLLWHMLHFSPV